MYYYSEEKEDRKLFMRLAVTGLCLIICAFIFLEVLDYRRLNVVQEEYFPQCQDIKMDRAVKADNKYEVTACSKSYIIYFDDASSKLLKIYDRNAKTVIYPK